jgi:hypothetical protein
MKLSIKNKIRKEHNMKKNETNNSNTNSMDKSKSIELFDLRIPEIEKSYEVFHNNFINNEAKAKGEEEGRINSVDPTQSAPTPFEQKTRTSYQGKVFEILSSGKQYLNECYNKDFSIAQKNLNTHTPEYLENKISERKEEHDKKMFDLEDGHNDKIKNIHNDLQLDKAREEYETAKGIAQGVYNLLGRRETDALIKSFVAYFVAMTIIGLVEAAFHYQAFKLFRESTLLTFLLALAPIILTPVTGHFSGVFIKQRKEKKIYLLFAVILVIIVTGVNYYSAQVRTDLLQKKNAVSGGYQLFFFLLSEGLFIIAIVISYLRHDSNHRFTVVTEKLAITKEKYDVLKNQAHITIQNEQNNKQQVKTRLSEDDITERKQIKELPDTFFVQRNEAISKYNSILAYFQSLELQINEDYKTTIHEYRNTIMKFCNTRKLPEYWSQPIPDLKLMFQNEKELTI